MRLAMGIRRITLDTGESARISHWQQAQAKFHENMIRIVVPLAAGAGVDSTARVVGRQLQVSLKVPVLIENRAGASGAIG